ncbi:methylmalonyl-CoA epimerase, mitochondrial [Tympanuchus pallidicinctus]|uniref:methylmalonyl-CoA epimerase, mitochondrial n=1 Tax=Tympanuchus pallidicinctus TaxID=109042 RepID=UPI00228742D0|nr:methylmalonyl-CoA epimerase, mitochondrial [Tympanuchus pallidicinctus]
MLIYTVNYGDIYHWARRPRSPWGRGTTPPCRARTVTPEWARSSAPSLRPRAPLGTTTGRGAVAVTAEGGPAPPACGRSGCERWGGDMAASLGRAAAGLLTRLQTSVPTVRTLLSSNSVSQNIPSCLWKLGRLNHVAIAVPDLEKAQSLYKDVLGARVSETVALPEHGVYTVFVELGNTKLELLHPLGEKSPIASFLQKNKTGGMHHICIEVDDIKAAMAELKKKKIRILSEEPKIGAHGKPVIFLHPKDCHGVLVELEQA